MAQGQGEDAVIHLTHQIPLLGNKDLRPLFRNVSQDLAVLVEPLQEASPQLLNPLVLKIKSVLRQTQPFKLHIVLCQSPRFVAQQELNSAEFFRNRTGARNGFIDFLVSGDPSKGVHGFADV